MRARRLVIIGCVLLQMLTGCHYVIYGSTAELKWIGIGMTKSQVIAELGPPVSSESYDYKREEHLYFKKADTVFSTWPRTFLVVFQYNRVTRWSEQTSFVRN